MCWQFSTLCLSLQTANLTHADLLLLLDTTKTSLNGLRAGPGVHIQGFLDSLPAAPEVLCKAGPATTFPFKGHELPINEKQVKTFQDVADKFIDKLVTPIDDRFQL